MNSSLFQEYLIRLLPGLVVLILALGVIPKKLIELRIVLFILVFVLFRDAMTPLRLWSISPDMVIRLPEDPFILVALGVSSAAFVALIQWSEPELRKFLIWFKGSKVASVALGILGALIIALPVIARYRMLPPEARGTVVSTENLLPLLTLAMLGNFLEEAIFRGYLQGYLETKVSPARTAARFFCWPRAYWPDSGAVITCRQFLDALL